MPACWLGKLHFQTIRSQEQITPIFSPRDSLQALDWYAEQAKGANDALFMTFAFGMNQRFQDAYRTGTAKLRYALMESMSGPTRTKEQREANEAAIIELRKNEREQVRDWIAFG